MPTRGEIVSFSQIIQDTATKNEVSLWETLVDYCNDEGIEHVVAASLLTKSLKDQIMVEVQELNLLKGRAKKGGKLPIF